MKTDSIFSQKRLDFITERAKYNLQNSAQFLPVLFVKCEGEKKTGIVPIDMIMAISDSDTKRQLFVKLGESVRQQHGKIQEAIMIADTWYIDDKQDMADTPVRDNPAKKEMLMLVGRDYSRKTTIGISMPYNRIDGKIVFEKTEVKKDANFVGLLDYLFGLSDGLLADRAMENRKEKNHAKN